MWFRDQYTWTWVSNPIRPSVRCPSAIGLKSYDYILFCFCTYGCVQSYSHVCGACVCRGVFKWRSEIDTSVFFDSSPLIWGSASDFTQISLILASPVGQLARLILNPRLPRLEWQASCLVCLAFTQALYTQSHGPNILCDYLTNITVVVYRFLLLVDQLNIHRKEHKEVVAPLLLTWAILGRITFS